MAHSPTEDELRAEWKAQPLLVRAFMVCVFAIVTLYMLAAGKMR